ncbi:FAD-binding oxidoreductase [Nocardioides sp. cx-169]|uniref:NAD(P)/FAD-dependent oxidoreductase n=1 Tax=Nocardioides sp. cx-169 TaxID=2899080 RepID=UPI001E3830CB|nr:FAD-dependent oxidoreductase [Nocardioides sp. cx-169]MCD4536071.1 FAD-binding oxidoreductase [Nocardioides sp. cx-169]
MTSPAAALAGAAPSVFWLEDQARPEALPPLAGRVGADLVVVGGGYAGLWTALRAVEREPGRSVVVLEAGRCGQEASGRNGGFASASLTHGFANGLARWPTELATLDRLGADNLRAIGDTVARHSIDCHWEETGELAVASAPHQLAELEELAAAMRAAGHEVALLDRTAVRARLDSPAFVGGLADPHGTALVEPARLAWGLRRACLDLGVRIFENTRATAIGEGGAGIVVSTTGGSAHAGQVALATNAFPSLLRRLRLRTVPVYDHVLMTEPLSAAQLALIGWAGREGVGDSANLFHYFRLTRDDRILWGGYDAVYHYGSRIAPDLEQSDRTHGLLAEQFFAAFPQLEGLRFTHRWGGVIDTCTRFAAFFGTARAGRVGYALGYTGLGVAATRFGADVVLDLLDGEETERTALEMVRRRPPPFPPEPARYAGIQLTRWSLARADRHGGRRNVWLRALDAAGLGFDS